MENSNSGSSATLIDFKVALNFKESLVHAQNCNIGAVGHVPYTAIRIVMNVQ